MVNVLEISSSSSTNSWEPAQGYLYYEVTPSSMTAHPQSALQANHNRIQPPAMNHETQSPIFTRICESNRFTRKISRK